MGNAGTWGPQGRGLEKIQVKANGQLTNCDAGCMIKAWPMKKYRNQEFGGVLP